MQSSVQVQHKRYKDDKSGAGQLAIIELTYFILTLVLFRLNFEVILHVHQH